MQDQYLCAICGTIGAFSVEGVAQRDDYRCGNCRGMVRQRDIAQLIVDEWGRGRASSLDALLDTGLLDAVAIYEVGIQGPVQRRLSKAPKYVNSYFWDDVPPGETKNGVRCEDITQLTFADSSFDLIVSLEVFEHVFHVEQAVSEVSRVLRPGGMHIFSVPVRYPLPPQTKVLAEMGPDGMVTYNEPPRYHVAGDQSKSLVVSDFGEDLIELHAEHGLRLSVVRRSAPMAGPSQNASFVARKVGL